MFGFVEISKKQPTPSRKSGFHIPSKEGGDLAEGEEWVCKSLI